MPDQKTKLDELFENGRFRLGKAGFVGLGVGIVAGSLALSHLLTWLTGIVLGG